MQGLRDQYDLVHAASLDGIVESANIIDPEMLQPVSVQPKCRQELWVGRDGFKQSRSVPAWKPKRESALRHNQFIPLQESGRRHHVAMVVVHPISKAVQRQVVFAAVFQQPDFVRVAEGLEVSNSLLEWNLALQQGNIRVDQLLHARP